ncbi:MAG: M48 family metallopeptidase [Betaproteobacteria bacterium]|nr:M48 family metallopeptidase [Betaproteobacteria bacterium]
MPLISTTAFRQGATPRRIELPGGAVAVCEHNEAVDETFQLSSHATLAHRLESHAGFVLAALAGIAVSMAIGYLYGIPWVAGEIAQRIPVGIEKQLAEQSLKSLDQALFGPSELPSEKQKDISATFSALRQEAGLPGEVRLEYRAGHWIGANALALPGGVVIITDELVAAVPGKDEIAAVLAHELGHVHYRHSLRQLLQSSITAMTAMAIYGDVTAITGLAASVPAMLAHTGYSRAAERESDNLAFVLLKKTGRSPRAFASAMAALEQTSGKKNPGSGRAKIPGYLSTHPATDERIEAALENSE